MGGGRLLDQTATYCRTLNQALITRQSSAVQTGLALARIPWPTTTFRGTWMPLMEVEWYKRMEGKSFRVSQYLPTSESEAVATFFLRNFAPSPQALASPERLTPVLFNV